MPDPTAQPQSDALDRPAQDAKSEGSSITPGSETSTERALMATNPMETKVIPSAPAEHPTPLPLPSVPGYELLGELGRGGMGVVYRARHLRLQRIVALKMIRDASLASPRERERFQTEAEAVARFQHPHIVQIFEIGEHEGRPYFSLEFVSGGSLADKVGAHPMGFREAAGMTESLARAVHAAHERGIVHRDLKPANILLTPDGQPKITDFGLAKRIDNDVGRLRAVPSWALLPIWPRSKPTGE